jgi:hypothetical protein
MNILTAFKDLLGVLLLAFLLPVWMVLGLAAVGVVATRQLYWWAHGNTSVASRPAARTVIVGSPRGVPASHLPDYAPAPAAAGGGLT